MLSSQAFCGYPYKLQSDAALHASSLSLTVQRSLLLSLTIHQYILDFAASAIQISRISSFLSLILAFVYHNCHIIMAHYQQSGQKS